MKRLRIAHLNGLICSPFERENEAKVNQNIVRISAPLLTL